MSGEAVGVPRGLPAHLPPGERLLWQGAPGAATLAREAYHVRAVAIYFGVLVATGCAVALAHRTTPTGALVTAGCGAAAVGLLYLLAWASARSAVYTLTDRRLVLRIGVALPKSINLPLDRIAAVDVSNAGDVVLTLAETPPLGWAALWPHARPWRLARPQPALRCLADGAAVARRIAQACDERTLATRPATVAAPAAVVQPLRLVAAA